MKVSVKKAVNEVRKYLKISTIKNAVIGRHYYFLDFALLTITKQKIYFFLQNVIVIISSQLNKSWKQYDIITLQNK